MRPEDIDECARLVAGHPVIGARYGHTAARLAAVWRSVLGREAILTGVIEAVDGPKSTICFVGFTACVNDSFISTIKTPPLAWIGPRLLDRLEVNSSPLLTDSDVQKANTRGGLNCIVWEGCLRPGFESAETYRKLMAVFLEMHRGYLWKEIIASQLESTARLHWTLSTGALWWDPVEHQYRDDGVADPNAFVNRPHLVGLTRDIESHRTPSWVGELFQHRPPRLGFTRSEQQLLIAALELVTDEELAASLGVSLPTIKKRWQCIYDRATSELPTLTVDSVNSSERSARGKEKKRRLLAYLRDHVEELRPQRRRLAL